MPYGFPVWSMGQMQRPQRPAEQPRPQRPAPEPEKPRSGEKTLPLPFLSEGLRLDRDTLLLIALAWLLWQEKADRRLILALVYILM